MGDGFFIDFKGFIKLVTKHKWFIGFVLFLSISLGVLYIKFSKEEFISVGRILPEVQGKGVSALGQFAGLASMAGIDLNSMNNSAVDAVRPDLYPNVINNNQFYIELFKINIEDQFGNKLSFKDFYIKEIDDKISKRDTLFNKLKVKSDSILLVSPTYEKRFSEMRERIQASIDKKTGIITISVKMPDPVVAAITANFAMNYLMSYIKSYRTEKLKQDVNYLNAQVEKSRNRYYSSQEKKASYADQFKDIMLQSADVKRERIEADYRLNSSFYNELLKRLEEAKFKLQQDTPVFKVLDPPAVPNKESEPKKLFIFLASIIIGGGVSLLIILIKNQNYKSIIRIG